MENQDESSPCSTGTEEEVLAKLKKSDAYKAHDIEDKAHSAILLSLGDEVLREVSVETQALAVLEK